MKVVMVRDDLETSKEVEVELPQDSTVMDLLDKRGIASEEVLASVDGTVVSNKRKLEEGEEVKVFDVIAGG